MGYKPLYNGHAWRQVKPKVFLYILTFLLLLLKKVGKIYPYFVVFLIKKIIPLALVGYKMIVAKSARLSPHIQQALVCC